MIDLNLLKIKCTTTHDKRTITRICPFCRSVYTRDTETYLTEKDVELNEKYHEKQYTIDMVCALDSTHVFSMTAML